MRKIKIARHTQNPRKFPKIKFWKNFQKRISPRNTARRISAAYDCGTDAKCGAHSCGDKPVQEYRPPPPPPLLKFRKISKKPKFAANTKSAAYAKSAARDRETDAKCGAHSCEGMPVRNTPVAQGTPKYPHQIQKRASGRTPKNLTIKRKNRRLPNLKLEITSQWPTAPPPPPPDLRWFHRSPHHHPRCFPPPHHSNPRARGYFDVIC